jgi:hypothetical protein
MDWMTNFMQNSLSWEANTSPASQEIRRIFYNLKVRYRIHKSSPIAKALQAILPHPTSCTAIFILYFVDRASCYDSW